MKDIIIQPQKTIKEALKQLDKCATKTLFVVDENTCLIGALSDGDVRRFIISGGDLNESIEEIYNRNPYYLEEGCYTQQNVKDAFVNKKIEVIPIVTADKKVNTYITWDMAMVEGKKSLENKKKFLSTIPVIIMAGGKGTRLKPFTDVLPKPLVPIQDKPIMDWIIEEFTNFGAEKIYATLNYRGKMIEAYYGSIEKDYEIAFVWEPDFLGTAGSLKLLEKNIESTFIVSNCDIIVKANYGEVLDSHRKSNACMTIVSSIQHHQIPYGVIEFCEGGIVTMLNEKPEYTHVINTGVYLLEKECLEYIPDNTFFHITQLVDHLIRIGKKVVTYPVNERAYIDVGQWEEYMNIAQKFKF